MVYLWRIVQYFLHRLRAVNEHGIHSPFVYEWYIRVKQMKKMVRFPAIDALYKQAIQNKEPYQYYSALEKRQLDTTLGKHIARSTMPLPDRQWIAATASFLCSKKIVELGTNAGFTAFYIAALNPQATVYTLEHDTKLWRLAQYHAQNLSITNVCAIFGTFEEVLEAPTPELNGLDMALVDGAHHYNATLKHTLQLLDRASANAVFIFHDIYWSPEMTRCWRHICAMDEFTMCLDLFNFGIVFTSKKFTKTYYRLKL